jgi:hypothetical protein
MRDKLSIEREAAKQWALQTVFAQETQGLPFDYASMIRYSLATGKRCELAWPQPSASGGSLAAAG